jgi:hypothetical protein
VSDYHSIKRLSNSALSRLKDCPELFKREFIDGVSDREETEAMALGSLVHCLVLEPEEVDKLYAVAPQCDRRTKEGKATWSQFVAESDVVKQETFDEAAIIACNVNIHEQASVVLSAKGYTELPVQFEIDGIGCKSKIDYLSDNHEIVFDLKTTQSAKPDDFASSVVKFGYHRQAAFYCEAVRRIYGTEPRFIFCAVSTQYPYLCGCYELDEQAIGLGRIEIDGLLNEYKQRLEANDWSSEFTKGINVISLPKWYSYT